MNFRKYLIPAVLAGSLLGGIAVAQVGMPGMPTAETMQRMQDGRIAGVIAALKMNEEQLKLWAPLEKLVREHQAERLTMMQDRMAAAANTTAAPAVALPDRLDKMAERMSKHAEQLKAFSVAFKPFYASLSDAQKAVVQPLMAQLEGGGRGHGFGMGGGRGWGHGGGHGKGGWGRHHGMMDDGQGAPAPAPQQ
jgi:hypothetical protein